MERSTRKEDSDPLTQSKLFHQPEHRKQKETYEDCFKHYVHLFIKNEFFFDKHLGLTMRNIYNAVADTIQDLAQDGINLQEITIFEDPDNQRRHILRIHQPHIPNSSMEVEVIEDNNDHIIACVLDRCRISYATMSAFMDRLLTLLDDE